MSAYIGTKRRGKTKRRSKHKTGICKYINRIVSHKKDTYSCYLEAAYQRYTQDSRLCVIRIFLLGTQVLFFTYKTKNTCSSLRTHVHKKSNNKKKFTKNDEVRGIHNCFKKKSRCINKNHIIFATLYPDPPLLYYICE